MFVASFRPLEHVSIMHVFSCKCSYINARAQAIMTPGRLGTLVQTTRKKPIFTHSALHHVRSPQGCRRPLRPRQRCSGATGAFSGVRISPRGMGGGWSSPLQLHINRASAALYCFVKCFGPIVTRVGACFADITEGRFGCTLYFV